MKKTNPPISTRILKQEELNKGDKLICLFMEYNYKENMETHKITKLDGTDFNFHIDGGAIMPVIEKLDDLESIHDIEIHPNLTIIHADRPIYGTGFIEGIYKAVTTFLTHHL